MSTNHTPNYNLSQWVRTDKIQMDDFNADNAKLDAALEEKADKSALSALQAAVNTKANQSALNGLSSTVANHAAALGKKGNCRIETFTYTGAGTAGDGGTTNLNFSAKPVLFLILRSGYLLLATGQNPCSVVLTSVYGETRIYSVGMNWSGNQCQLSSSDADLQANASGSTYCVVAFYSQS